MRFSSQPEPFSGSGRFPDHLLIVHHPYKFIPNSTTPTTTKHPYITLSAFVLLSLIQKSQPDDPENICQKHHTASPNHGRENEHGIYKRPTAF